MSNSCYLSLFFHKRETLLSVNINERCLLLESTLAVIIFTSVYSRLVLKVALNLPENKSRIAVFNHFLHCALSFHYNKRHIVLFSAVNVLLISNILRIIFCLVLFMPECSRFVSLNLRVWKMKREKCRWIAKTNKGNFITMLRPRWSFIHILFTLCYILTPGQSLKSHLGKKQKITMNDFLI